MSARQDAKRILVVDDEPSVRETIKMLLDLYGYQVHAVANGNEAIHCLENGGFDLLITDYSMSGINGDQLSLQIKQRWPHQPVLLLTAYAGTRDDSSFANVDGVLGKPFMAEELKDAVAKLLAR